MDNFQFEYNNKTYQIRFSFPDKWNEIYRRFTIATLFEKIVNPEDNKDYMWQEVDLAEAKCNINIKTLENGDLYNFGDKFDKYIGKKVAFTKLINSNFNRDFRKQLWKQFFETYGLKITVIKNIFIETVLI